LLPAALATWLFGSGGGLCVAVLATLASWFADMHGQRGFNHPVYTYWDAAMHFAIFAVVAVILGELRLSYRRIADLARLDGLTGLANRRRFYELAEHELNRARRSGLPVTSVHIDIDNFKEVNDTLGHAAGDRLLTNLAESLRRLRKTDVAARLGGDEFVVLMPDTGQEAAELVVAKLQRDMQDTVKRGGWAVTFSIGVATFFTPPDSVEQMVHEADEAMYTVKRTKKNDVRYVVSGQTVRGDVP
jgi:diguanylate cyclase (GGDEF)-like protein